MTKIDDLIAAYENLPIGFGEKVMGEVCKFINENRKGFDEVKLLHEENKRLRDLLEETGQRLSALHRLWCEQNGCPAHSGTIENIERIKQALGDKRDE